MMFATTLRTAREAARLTQSELATRTGIARPNITAYETGRREPLFSTAQTVLAATGASWQITAPLTWSWTPTRRPYAIPSRLWRLSPADALRQFETAAHLWWSGPRRTFDLAQRDHRLRAYEIVLREGGPDDITTIVDEVLLHDAWPELVLPRELRHAWEHLIDLSVAHEATGALAS
jgi:transcriptional regulator with XRE-family HTH domain